MRTALVNDADSHVSSEARLQVTGHEVSFAPDEIIVSKTDTRGIMTYVNDVFLDVSGYTEAEMIGSPHSTIRHPHMPRGVFKLLWDTIKDGREIFAYVVNRCKNGDHYWVLAHVTPTFTADGQIIGYHSSRRCPHRRTVEAVQPLYARLLAEEQRLGGNGRAALESSGRMLTELLAQKGISYEEFVLSL